MSYHNKKGRKFKKVLFLLVAICLTGGVTFLYRDIPPPTHAVVKTIDNARFAQ